MSTVVLADEDVDTLDVLQVMLVTAGHVVYAVSTGRDALQALSRAEVDVVLADVGLSDMSGLEVCAHVVGNRPDIPVILMSAGTDVSNAIGAIRAGAYDYLSKPIVPGQLHTAIDRATLHGSLQRRIHSVDRHRADATFDEIVGGSPAMRDVFDMIQRVADSDTSVLVVGASGTGKELVARALHTRSRRREGKFVSINCAALPEALLESELFGHARGSFTDAKTTHAGLFAEAHGGTLLLDEIGDMPLALQPKLLRALQQRTVRPVGSTTEVPIDVRIVAATHHDLEVAVAQKRFRADLFFRLNVVQIPVPPLQARGADVLLLADHFLRQFVARGGKSMRRISNAAAERLFTYDWPGNVRELQNSMERAVALGRYDEVGVDDLPEPIRNYSLGVIPPPIDDSNAPISLHEVSRRYIVRVLAMAGGNKTVAARWLGIDRKTLYRRLDRASAALPVG